MNITMGRFLLGLGLVRKAIELFDLSYNEYVLTKSPSALIYKLF